LGGWPIEVDARSFEVVVSGHDTIPVGTGNRCLVGIGDPARRRMITSSPGSRSPSAASYMICLLPLETMNLLQCIVEMIFVALELALYRSLSGFTPSCGGYWSPAECGLVCRRDGVGRRREVRLARGQAHDLHALGAPARAPCGFMAADAISDVLRRSATSNMVFFSPSSVS